MLPRPQKVALHSNIAMMEDWEVNRMRKLYPLYFQHLTELLKRQAKQLAYFLELECLQLLYGNHQAQDV